PIALSVHRPPSPWPVSEEFPVIALLSTLACVLAMAGQWLLAQGKLYAVYRLSIVTSLCFITLNTALALMTDWSVILLTIPSVWTIYTCSLGLQRLKEE